MQEEKSAEVETGFTLRLTRSYPNPIERLWAAVSQAGELTAWMDCPAWLEARVGGHVHIEFGPEGALDGVVCACEPDRRLAYVWDNSIVCWDLRPDGNGCELEFAHIGVRAEHVAGLGAGWHAFLDHLGPYLAGNYVEDRFDELLARYEANMASLTRQSVR